MTVTARGFFLLASIVLSSCADEPDTLARAAVRVEADAPVGASVALVGATLVIPDHATDVPITVTLTELPEAAAPAGYGIVLSPTFRLSPEGATFDKMLTLTIDVATTGLPAGAAIDDVVVLRAPRASSDFLPLTTSVVGSAVRVSVDHFSDFVAVYPTPPANVTLAPTNGRKHVFVTQAHPAGPLGGTSGADAYCMWDRARPTAGVYRAVLGTADRRVCTSPNCSAGPDALDWVLAPSTVYYLGPTTAEVVWTTTDTNALPTFPFGAALGSGVNFWLGMFGDFTVDPTRNCADFTDGSSTLTATVGWDADLIASAFNGGFYTCADMAEILCVEQ